jgi:hypothetical protein
LAFFSFSAPTMASFPITLPSLPPVPPSLSVGAIAAVAPAALLNAEADALPLPFAQPLPAAPSAATPEGTQDGAAMRPDQVFMARQLVFQAPDARALASAWRAMVSTYGAQLASRGQQARAGQLPPALLAAAQAGRVWRQPEGAIPPDAWRFTVHAGGPQAQHLQVLADDNGQPPERRKRRRAALRLELELDGGTRVMVVAELAPGGVALQLCAPDEATLDRLREMKPALEVAVARAGLRVVRWTFLDRLPAGPTHATLPSADAGDALSLPVFRAMAELALLLPAAPADDSGQPALR